MRTNADGRALFWVVTDDPEPDIEKRVILVNCPYGQVGDRLWCKHKHYLLDEHLIPTTDILYRLTDDRIGAILISSEVQNGRYKTDEWSPSQAYSNLSQRGLHGGLGWSNLLTNEIQRIWAEGIRGLVSATRTQQRQRLPSNIYEPQQSQGDQECSPSSMYGFSWDAPFAVISGQTLRRRSEKQPAIESTVGNASGELARQRNSRQRYQGRGSPNGQTNEFRNEGIEVGDRETPSQSTSGCQNTWDVSGWHLCCCSSQALVAKPSIFMPRWASRILLEITKARVERLQEISEADAIAEGVERDNYNESQGWRNYFSVGCLSVSAVESFYSLWNRINWKRGLNAGVNPWVWVLGLRRVSEE